MIGFFEKELLPSWLTKPEQVRRLADDQSTGSACYVVELLSADRIYHVWVNQDSGMIEQIKLPLQYLDSEILASEQVTDLRFFVRFHDAVMNQPIADETFKYKERIGAKVVSRFVTLPEPMPSERVGERSRQWTFLNPDGRNFEKPEGAIGVVWLVAGNEMPLAEQLSALTQDEASKVIVAFSDDLLKQPGSKRYEPIADLAKLLRDANLTYVYDPQMQNSSQIKLKSVPAFVVFDADSTIQFAKMIDEDHWTDELKVALQRVANGENLAAELKRDYQKFLDKYHQEIAAQSRTSTKTGNVDFESKPYSKLEEIAELIWQTDKFKNAGNIHIQQSMAKTFVLDGWQTVVELGSIGQEVARHRLPIPTSAAINRMRSFSSKGKVYFAAYSMLGPNVFLFDENFKLLQQLPGEDEENVPRITICDCQFSENNLWIGTIDHGIYQFRIGENKLTKVSDESVRDLDFIDDRMICVREGKMEFDDDNVQTLNKWTINALASNSAQNLVAATGKDDLGTWRLFVLDADTRVLWQTND